MASSTAQTIWDFLIGKGLTPAQASGVLGNLKWESGLSTTAYNGREGAIGLAQWEGSRRTALEQFAQERGTSETDLQTQLDFLWNELTGSESGALQSLKQATTASDAASIWQSQYERSAQLDPQRVQYANDFFSAYQSGDLNAATGPQSAGSQQLSPQSDTATSDPVPTEQDYQQSLGDLEKLLTTVPELNTLLHQAMSGKWSTTTFLDKIHQSDWWQTHNDAERQLLGEQFTDRQQYVTTMVNGYNQVYSLASQLGVHLDFPTVKSLALQAIDNSWTQDQLKQQIGAHFSGSPWTGQAAQLDQQLKQLYGEYGLPISPAVLESSIRSLLSGRTTMDTYTQQAITSAKSMYPSLSGQLDTGLTVKQIADPYVTTMSNLLEIAPDTISLQDPTIKKALQGSVIDQGQGKATVSTTPIWQFENQLREDPRWSQTQNAHDTINSALATIGRDWGFLG